MKDEAITPRARLLADAIHATDQRGAKYGPPEVHFARTVGMVNAAFAHVLTRPLTTGEWAQIMVLDKVARHQAVPQKDNLLDIAGYAACSFECDREKLEDS
jgi:hypothetical protein